MALVLIGQPLSDGAVDVKIADPTAGDINPSSCFVVVRGTAILDTETQQAHSTDRPADISIAKDAVAVSSGDPLYLSRSNPGQVTNVLTGFTAGDDVVQIGVATASALSGDALVSAYLNPAYMFEY